MSLVYTEIMHLSASLLVGGSLSLLSGSYLPLVLSLVAGFFIDGDHLIDYLIFRGSRVTLKGFFSGNYFKESQKAYIFLHSWELAFGIVSLGLVANSSLLFYSVGLSMAVHLLIDQFTNSPGLYAYFLYHRITHKFDLKSSFPLCS